MLRTTLDHYGLWTAVAVQLTNTILVCINAYEKHKLKVIYLRTNKIAKNTNKNGSKRKIADIVQIHLCYRIDVEL